MVIHAYNEENSNLYIFTKDSFKKRHNRIVEKPYLFGIDKLEALDISIMEDFKLTEIVKKSQLKI